MATQYLVFGTSAGAQTRSSAQAQVNGCSAPTIYWWDIIAHPSNGQGALVVSTAPYDATYLTAGEIAGLVSVATMAGNGWVL